MIYFIGCPEAEAVKIGTTTNRVYERLNQAQVNCPLKLELLAAHDGGYAEEATLHLRFAAQRIRGEWFRLSDELTAHIQQLPKPEKPARGWYGQTRNRMKSRRICPPSSDASGQATTPGLPATFGAVL